MAGLGEFFDMIPQALKMGEALSKQQEKKPAQKDKQENVVQPEKKGDTPDNAALQKQLRQFTSKIAPTEMQWILNAIDVQGDKIKVNIPQNIPGQPREVSVLADRLAKMEQLHREYQRLSAGGEKPPAPNSDFWQESADRNNWNQGDSGWSQAARKTGVTPDFNPDLAAPTPAKAPETPAPATPAPEQPAPPVENVAPAVPETPPEPVAATPVVETPTPDARADFWSTPDSNNWNRGQNAWNQTAEQNGLSPDFNPAVDLTPSPEAPPEAPATPVETPVVNIPATPETPTPTPENLAPETPVPESPTPVVETPRDNNVGPAPEGDIISGDSPLRSWVRTPENGQIIPENSTVRQRIPVEQQPDSQQINERFNQLVNANGRERDTATRSKDKKNRTVSRRNNNRNRRQTAPAQQTPRPAPARTMERRQTPARQPENRPPRRETPARPTRTAEQVDQRFQELARQSRERGGRSQAEVDRRFQELANARRN